MLEWRPVAARRVGQLAGRDPVCADLVRRLLGLAVAALPEAHEAGVFAFTLRRERKLGQQVWLRPEGTNPPYSAIACLGLPPLAEPGQHRVLSGYDCDDGV